MPSPACIHLRKHRAAQRLQDVLNQLFCTDNEFEQLLAWGRQVRLVEFVYGPTQPSQVDARTAQQIMQLELSNFLDAVYFETEAGWGNADARSLVRSLRPRLFIAGLPVLMRDAINRLIGVRN